MIVFQLPEFFIRNYKQDSELSDSDDLPVISKNVNSLIIVTVLVMPVQCILAFSKSSGSGAHRMLNDPQEPSPKKIKSDSVQGGSIIIVSYHVPVLLILSSLDPQVSDFLSLSGYPIGEHSVRRILEFEWLNDDVR